MEEEKKEKLIIDGNAVYEIDMECWKQKQKKEQEKNRKSSDKKEEQGN